MIPQEMALKLCSQAIVDLSQLNLGDKGAIEIAEVLSSGKAVKGLKLAL